MIIRLANTTDQAYVASTLVQSLGYVDKPMPSYERGQLVDRLLDKPGIRACIACDVTDQHHIHGWILYTPMESARCLHYVYVRNRERTRGIGAALASYAGLDTGKPVVFTLQGPDASWLRAKYPGATHLPIEDFIR